MEYGIGIVRSGLVQQLASNPGDQLMYRNVVTVNNLGLIYITIGK